MRFSNLVTVALAGAASAAPLEARSDFKSDDIMVAGLQALNRQIAQHGYPNAQKCTLKNASVRREWYASYPPTLAMAR
jgi:tyrosinase